MAWPMPDEYYEAIQNLSYCFTDPELQSGTVPMSAMGLPKLGMSGSFASVYQVNCKTRKYAIRCFLKEIQDQERRYKAISDHLKAARLPCMVGFEYLREGIRIKGRWFPILKMEWTEGEPLNAYVDRNISKPHELQTLARRWIETIISLRNHKIAHGDLQHGNILVHNGTIKLIDYDGMYVPALTGMKSNEEGHRNYQHPLRNGNHFGENIDNFSAWVIFISLSILSINPRLWKELSGGDEHLLFKQDDFKEPLNSKIFKALNSASNTSLQLFGGQFRTLLTLPLERIPALDGFSNNPTPTPTNQISGGLPSWIIEVETFPKLQPLEFSKPKHFPGLTAEWLFDQLVISKPAALVNIDWNFSLERKAFLFCLAVIVLYVLAMLLTIGFSQPVYLTLSCIGGLVTSFASYFFFISHRYRNAAFSKKKKELSKAITSYQKEIRSLESTAGIVQAETTTLDEKLQLIRSQYHDIQPHAERALENARKVHSGKMQDLDRRKANLTREEVSAIQMVEHDAQAALAALNRQRGELANKQHEEVIATLRSLRQQHIQDCLLQKQLQYAVIAGIGPALKTALLYAGIRTAGDVTYHRVINISGIGDAKASALCAWKSQIANQAEYSAPSKLPLEQRDAIIIKYKNILSCIDDEICKREDRARAEKEAITARNEAARRQIIGNESLADADFQAATAAIHAKFKVEQLRLKQEFDIEKGKGLNARKSIDEKLSELNNGMFEKRLSLHQTQSELAQYSTITFAKYVRHLFWMGI